MDVNVVTIIAKSLRKIYAITKQNMKLLDKALVQSYLEHFPNDNTNIVTANTDLKIVNGKSPRLKNSTMKAKKDKLGASKKKVKMSQLSNDI